MNQEHNEQAALFQMISYQTNKYPELELMFAIPNGGARHIAVAKKLKAEGVKAGVPDIFLPIARNGYHGLFIEMKVGKNKPTESQRNYLDKLEDEGYLIDVCYSSEEAYNLIMTYLKNATSEG